MFFIICIIELTNCCKETPSSTYTFKKLHTISLKDNKSERVPGYYFADNIPHYENIFLSSGKFDGKLYLMGIDIITGKILWKSSPTDKSTATYQLNPKEQLAIIDGYYYFTSFSDNEDFLIKLNMRDGSFEKLNNVLPPVITNVYYNGVLGFERTIFVDNAGLFIAYANIDDLKFKKIPTPVYNTFFTPEVQPAMDKIHTLCSIWNYIPLKNKEGDLCVFIRYNDFHPSKLYPFINDGRTWSVQKLSLYNIDQQKWVYNGVDIFDDNNKLQKNTTEETSLIYFQNGLGFENIEYSSSVFAVDAYTGKLIWKKNTEGTESSTGVGWDIHAMVNGKLYCSSSAAAGICLDAKTGDKLFEFNGNGYNAMESDGKNIYGASQGDGMLKCFDLNNGKTKTQEDIHMARSIGIYHPQDGQKAKIMVHNFNQAFIYEAVE